MTAIVLSGVRNIKKPAEARCLGRLAILDAAGEPPTHAPDPDAGHIRVPKNVAAASGAGVLP